MKQFGFLALGFILAGVMYASPLPGIFKWPLVLLFGFGGLGLAFMPVEERSLDRWFLSFIRAVYSPTQYVWKKENEIPWLLQTTVQPQQIPQTEVTTTQEGKGKLEEYLRTLPQKPHNTLDLREQGFLNKLDFSAGESFLESTSIIAPPPIPREEKIYKLPGLEENRKEAQEDRMRKATTPLASNINYATERVISWDDPSKQKKFIPAIGSIRVRKLHTLPPITRLNPQHVGENDFQEELKEKLAHIQTLEEEPQVVQTTPLPAPTQMDNNLPSLQGSSYVSTDDKQTTANVVQLKKKMTFEELSKNEPAKSMSNTPPQSTFQPVSSPPFPGSFPQQQSTASPEEEQRLRKEIDALKEQNKRLVEEAQQTISQYRSQFDEIATSKKIVTDQFDEEVKKREDKISELVQKNQELANKSQQALGKYRNFVTELTKEKNELINQMNALASQQQQQLDQVIAESQKTTQEANQVIEEQDQKIASLTSQNQELVDQMQQLEEKLQSLEQKFSSIEQESNQRIQKQAQAAQQTLIDYQSKLEALTEENTQLKQQLEQTQEPQPVLPQRWGQPAPSYTPKSVTDGFPGKQPMEEQSPQEPQGQSLSYESVIGAPPPPPKPKWREVQERPVQMPIVGERSFQVSETLKKRLRPIGEVHQTPPVDVLKSSIGIVSEQQAQTMPRQTFEQPPQPAQQQHPEDQHKKLSFGVQGLMEKLSTLQQAAKGETKEGDFTESLQDTLQEVTKLSQENTEKPQVGPSAKKFDELSKTNEALLTQMQELKKHLEEAENQKELNEQQKEDFRKKLAESVETLEKVKQEREEEKKREEPVVKLVQEEIEPERQRVRVVKRMVKKGSIPPLTNTPNVINGVIKDARGVILPDTVIVIKDAEENAVRALKSNKLGQFVISTPVPDNIYTVELEKEGFSFDIIQVEVSGSILPPLEIRAR
ncbi:MAG TPA: hypothetical protein VJ179_01720 [Patescibacteria group bacterium]|nr:hypothetical protein [Patescibacteria group bacterium]